MQPRAQTVRNIQALDAAFNLYLQNQLSFQSTTTTTREQEHEDERWKMKLNKNKEGFDHWPKPLCNRGMKLQTNLQITTAFLDKQNF